jgi:hypothetical protein
LATSVALMFSGVWRGLAGWLKCPGGSWADARSECFRGGARRIGYRAPTSLSIASLLPGRVVKLGCSDGVEVLPHLNDTVPEPLVHDTPATGVTFGLRLQLWFLRRGAMAAWTIVTLNSPLIPV